MIFFLLKKSLFSQRPSLLVYCGCRGRSVQFSHSVVSESLQPRGLQHARPPCPSPIPGACSHSRPSSQWCRSTISSSVTPFSSCPQSFLSSGCFPISQLFTSDSQNIGASAWASILPMDIQDWFPLGLTGFLSLQSKGTLKSFLQHHSLKHQFFSPQPSLWSSSHIPTWLLKKP